MSFLNNIFNYFNPESKSVPKINIESNKVVNPKLAMLIESIKPFGHEENPFYNKSYSIASKVPSTDFSTWIKKLLLENDLTTINEFLKINESIEDYGINLSPVLDYYLNKVLKSEGEIELVKQELLKYENKNVVSLPSNPLKYFLSNNFARYINIEEDGNLDLQTYFILKNRLDSINREFWITDKSESVQLSKIISVYDFSVNIDFFHYLVNKANVFLKEMRRDRDTKDFWKDYNYYNISKISHEYKLNVETDILIELKKLSISERLLFFDFAEKINDNKYWIGKSSSKTRSVGVNENIAFNKFCELNLFEFTKDLDCIPKIYTKSFLQEKCNLANIELKVSWNPEKIYLNLCKTREGLIFLENLIHDTSILKIKNEYIDDILKLIEYQKVVKYITDLLCMVE